MSIARPRFQVWLPLQQLEYSFFSIAGVRQWLENEKIEGRCVSGATVYDNEEQEYVTLKSGNEQIWSVDQHKKFFTG